MFTGFTVFSFDFLLSLAQPIVSLTPFAGTVLIVIQYYIVASYMPDNLLRII